MATVVGFRDVNFDGGNGQITGVTVYYTEEAYRCEGLATGKFFLSDSRMNNIGYRPAVGQEIDISYNKYGKVSSVSVR